MLKMSFSNILRQAIFYPILLVVTLMVCNNPFFWDTVQLASKHGHFFYETNFSSLILPESIDSGHPPMFGMYIALVWKLFGKTLCVSHLAMLPFLFGIVYFLQAICSKFFDGKWAPWIVLLCLVDPVLAGQLVLVSPDLVLISCFLMALWAIWSANNSAVIFAVIGLGLISTRGMMLGVALFVFSIFVSKQKITIHLFFKNLLPFLPGGFLAASYLTYHWVQTGWVGYHVDSSWAPSFERVDFQGFVRNLAVMVWRLQDFGRVFVWGGLALVGAFYFKKSGWKLPKMNRHEIKWQFFMLTILTFFALGPTQLFYKGLLAHRYFLPFFLSLNLTFAYLLCTEGFKLMKNRWSKVALPIFCLLLAEGNFWVYPQKIAMGWDSTLAHLPWYRLSHQTEAYLKTANISYEEVGSAFPNIGSRELYELNGVEAGFVEKNFETNCYIFYSNIMNDFSDTEIEVLSQQWKVIFSKKIGGVCTILYKNPNTILCEN